MSLLDGRPVDPSKFDRYSTIENVFSRIQREIDVRADSLAATYDPVRGHPTRVDIDAGRGIADDEITITISQVTPIQR